MKIVILAIGSRGDVQPYIALGQGLQRVGGHNVTIAAVDHFKDFVEQYGLEFFSVAGDVGAMLQSEAAYAAMDSGSNTMRAVQQLIKMIEPSLVPLFEDCWQACQGAELIITSTLGVIGFPIAEKLGVPVVPALPYPLLSPTSSFQNPAWPFALNLPAPLSGPANRVSHYLAEQVAWQPFKSYLNTWIGERLELEAYPFLGPFTQLRRDKQPVLYGYSPSVIPVPTDWKSHEIVTGYWFLDDQEAYTPPDSLSSFLDEEPKPLYIGFGSMIDRDPERLLGVILNALQETDQRAILLSGWAGLANSNLSDSNRILVVDSVPHSWLFPRVSAVVHHGGAGTTAAGLRAGVPSIITPFFGDQPFWARTISRLGVGTEPIFAKNLTTNELVLRIEQVLTDHHMQEKAAQLGERIRLEDGTRNAAEAIDRLFLS